MNFSPDQLRAIELLSEGITETEVASILSKSRSWVQRQKKIPEFKEAIKSFKQKTASIFKEELEKNQYEAIQKEVESWEIRRQFLREQEWLASQKLFELAMKMLDDPLLQEKRWTFKDTTNILQVASELARVSSELWSSNLNAAIELTRRYGYDIIDQQQETSSEDFLEED